MGTPPPERAPKRRDRTRTPIRRRRRRPRARAARRRATSCPSSRRSRTTTKAARLREGDAEDALAHFRAATAIDDAHADAWARTGALRARAATAPAAGRRRRGRRGPARRARWPTSSRATRARSRRAPRRSRARRARALVRLGGALAEGADDDGQRALTRLRDGLAAAIAAAEPAVECEAHYAFAALLGPRLGRWRGRARRRGQAAWAHATSGAWAASTSRPRRRRTAR